MGGLLIITLFAARNLEPNELSLWLALNLVLAVGAVVDAGLRTSISRNIAWLISGAKELPKYSADSFRTAERSDGMPNDVGIVSTVRISRRLVRILAVGLLPLVGFAAWLICRNLAQAARLDPLEWNITLSLTVATVMITGYGGLYTGILQGLDKIPLINRIQGVIGLFRTVTLCLALLWQAKIFGLAVMTFLVQLTQLVALRWVVYENDHCRTAAHDQFGRDDNRLYRVIWPGMWRMIAVCLGGLVIAQGTSMLASRLRDPAEVAGFLFTVRLCTAIATIAIVPLSVCLPRIAGLRVEKNLEMIRSIIGQKMALILAGVIIALCMLFSLGNGLLTMVAPRLQLIDGWPALVLAAWLVFEVHHNMHAAVYGTVNHTPFLLPSLVSGAAIIFLGNACMDKYQVLGLVLVQFLVQLSFNNWYPVWLNLRSLDWPFTHYFGALLRELSILVTGAPRFIAARYSVRKS